MKLSARNVLKGKVAAIDKGKVTAVVTIDMVEGKVIGIDKGKVTAIVRIDIGGAVVTSSITMAALKDLKLKKGSDVHAIIKASEVLLGVDD